MRARRRREEWAALVRQIEATGESPAAFCAKRRIRLRTFEWWRWQLRQDVTDKKRASGKPASTKSRQSVRLMPVVVAGPAAATPTQIELSIRDVAVRVEVGTSVAYIGELVAELRSRC